MRTKTKIKTVHKTCPNWGETQCGKSLWPRGKPLKTSTRWERVTCEDCLAERYDSRPFSLRVNLRLKVSSRPSKNGEALITAIDKAVRGSSQVEKVVRLQTILGAFWTAKNHIRFLEDELVREAMRKGNGRRWVRQVLQVLPR